MSNLVTSSGFLIDTTPDAFAFADHADAVVSTVQTCVTVVTVAGLNVTDIPVVLTGTGEYRKNAGSWVTAAGVAENGDTFEVRHTSSANSSSSTNTTLSIGGRSDTFTSTTAAGVGDPMITGPSTITHNSPFTILGTNFGAVQGSGYVTLDNGIVIDTQSDIASWSDTAIVLNSDTVVNLQYGALTLSVTENGGSRGSFPVNYTWDVTTHQVVTILAGHDTGTGSLLDLAFTAPVLPGDLLEVDAPVSVILIDGIGDWVAHDGAFAYTLERRIYRHGDGEWSTTTVHIYQDPIISNYSLGSVYGDSANFSLETDVGEGDVAWFVSPSPTPPLPADLIAGVGAATFGTTPVEAIGLVNGIAALAVPDTQYYMHVLHANGTAYSDISTSEAFTSTWDIEDTATLFGLRGTVSGYGTVTVPIAPPPIDPGEPTLSAIGNILKGRLARFTASTSLDKYIMAELQQGQRSLEEDAFIPWFLAKTDSTSLKTAAGEDMVPWPADFLRECDEDYRSSLMISLDDYWRPLTKTDDEDIDLWGQDLGVPSRYSISGMNFRMGRVPDGVYSLRLRYYARAPAITEEVTENVWTKNASDYLIAQAGFRLAAMYLKNDTAAQIFLADVTRERTKLMNRHTAHFEANRERMDED